MSETEWAPAVGDRVILAAEAEHGADPNRVGVIIDTDAADENQQPLVAVQFPWSSRTTVLPPSALDLVESVGPEDGPPQAVLDAARAAGELLREHGIGNAHVGVIGPDGEILEVARDLIGRQIEQDMTEPDVEVHPFVGRLDRPCELEGCGKPDRNPIHFITPPYRLRYVEDLVAGDAMFVAGRRWVECTVLDHRDAGGMHSLILVDDEADQRPFQALGITLVPVPAEGMPGA